MAMINTAKRYATSVGKRLSKVASTMKTSGASSSARSMGAKAVSGTVSAAKTSGRSSGSVANATAFMAKHKVGIGVGAGVGLGGAAMMRRRRSGLNRTPGRPTGMYKY